MSLETALVSRWNATGLNTSIGLLYPGGEPEALERTGGDTLAQVIPEGTGFPRCQYLLFPEMLEMKTVDSRIHVAPVRFGIWHDSWAELEAFLDAVDGVFVNAEQAATLPLALSADEGYVMSVEYLSRVRRKFRRDLCLGILDIAIRWAKLDLIPG